MDRTRTIDVIRQTRTDKTVQTKPYSHSTQTLFMFTLNPTVQPQSIVSPEKPIGQSMEASIGQSSSSNFDSIPATRITVLLIDDQSMVSEILQRSLSKETDIDFHYCSDPTLAITTAIDIAPTIILQDLVMPDVDGLMLLRWFRLNPATKDIPMIVLSCKEDAHLKAEAFTHGANDYLIKLPDAIELVARIRYHSQAYQNLKALQSTTLAAQQQAQQLTQTLNQVQEMQAQIIQSEKMTGLGRMVAGIAHEINNPINFINGNVKHLGEYMEDLLSLIQLYQTTYPEPSQDIQTLRQSIDIDFLSQDLPKLMDSMKFGSERIRNIVLSLRNFSRLDESEKKAVSLEHGIDSTLMLLGHRLKTEDGTPHITIKRDYHDTPNIECFPAQLNQVFMHILNNAIDALENYPINETPTITISTRHLSHQVEIQIQDNGTGIPMDLHDRIFEPFFTTKSINQGTGLGLAICYKIMQKHHGTLTVQSAPGQGSTFTLIIPFSD
jgi:two-component system, NtrC family, sensor kinase